MAKTLKPEEKEPGIKIAEVQKLIDAIQTLDAAFSAALSEGKNCLMPKNLKIQGFLYNC